MRSTEKIYALGILLIALVLSTRVQAIDFAEPKEFEARFRLAITKANEYLQNSDRPRYKLVSAEVELSLVREHATGGGLKIPVAPVEAEGNLEYRNMVTVKERFTYRPLSHIPIGESDDFGLVNFVKKIQQSLVENSKKEGVIITEAEREERFVVKYLAKGKISFFSMISAGLGGAIENSHKVKFIFCLENNLGECVSP